MVESNAPQAPHARTLSDLPVRSRSPVDTRCLSRSCCAPGFVCERAAVRRAFRRELVWPKSVTRLLRRVPFTSHLKITTEMQIATRPAFGHAVLSKQPARGLSSAREPPVDPLFYRVSGYDHTPVLRAPIRHRALSRYGDGTLYMTCLPRMSASTPSTTSERHPGCNRPPPHPARQRDEFPA